MAVYDCFTFYHEIELLKLRFKFLDPYVDKFVIVELRKTHRGIDKSCIFQEHRKEFHPYEKKIIYICPEYIPEYKGDGDWTIENYQRNCIMKGLAECMPDDIIMVSDLDEFWDPRILSNKKEISVFPKDTVFMDRLRIFAHIFYAGNRRLYRDIVLRKCHDIAYVLDYSPVSCEQDLYYYYMNCKCRMKWHGTTISKYKNMPMPQCMRDNRNRYPVLRGGGWHFTYLGGVEKIKEKLRSIIDSNKDVIEKMKKYASDDDYIEKCLDSGTDIYGRRGKMSEFEFIPLPEIGFPGIEHLIKENPGFYRPLKKKRKIRNRQPNIRG